MIIEALKLSNWLSYPTYWDSEGQKQPPCLNFDQESVYLIFGKNGAGKSSIMDAILFALFGDYSRSMDRQEIRQSSAIRTGEKTAFVELTFALNSTRHRVFRNVAAKFSSARYDYWDVHKEQWVVEASQVKDVNAKLSALLGMDRDLFCGTVVLEQGKTGHFMELKPKDQTEHVKNLLGLDIYSKYHEKAKELANSRKRSAKKCE
ncbi:SMC family ATPase, partial [Candidatus Saccharibacteria bacterium]|nr:SMC family ATPase [Candidatus Saccharibacteria bacterium]